jgi:hypothetical protein
MITVTYKTNKTEARYTITFETRAQADAWIADQQEGGLLVVLSIESTGAAALSRIFG